MNLLRRKKKSSNSIQREQGGNHILGSDSAAISQLLFMIGKSRKLFIVSNNIRSSISSRMLPKFKSPLTGNHL